MREKKALLFYLSFTLDWLCFFPYPKATAQEIAVIKSQDIEPCNQALAGFIAACPKNVSAYNLRGSKREEVGIIERISVAKPRLILALGSLAA